MTVEKLSKPNKILKKVLEQLPKYLLVGSDKELIEYHNLCADLWRYVIGVNAMPAQIKGLAWQDKPIPDWQHVAWKNQGIYKDGTAVAGKVKWLRPDKSGVFRTRKGDSLECRIDGNNLVVEKVGIQGNIIASYKIDPKSAWPYKIEKTRKGLAHAHGPGHNSILSTPSSFHGDE
jgi:hypothetical protein